MGLAPSFGKSCDAERPLRPTNLFTGLLRRCVRFELVLHLTIFLSVLCALTPLSLTYLMLTRALCWATRASSRALLLLAALLDNEDIAVEQATSIPEHELQRRRARVQLNRERWCPLNPTVRLGNSSA
eukprot:4703652-Pyramimonas_sp.AAC.1